MATYYVDGVSGNDSTGTGATGSPWKTLAKANTAASAGDTIKVRTATYYEKLVISKTNLTFENDTGHSPTIDGRWHPGLFGAAGYVNLNGQQVKTNEVPSPTAANANRGNWVVVGEYAVIVGLSGSGATIKGFTIRNVCGKPVSITGNNARMESCRIDFCYSGAVGMDQGANMKLINTVITRASMKKYDPSNKKSNGQHKGTQTTVIIKECTDPLVEGCTVAFNYGEGISCDKGSVRPVIRYCTTHTNGHWNLGINETTGAKIYGNLSFWCDNLIAAMDKDTPSDCFTVGNELVVVQGQEYPERATLNDCYIYNNLFIGGKRTFMISSGTSGRPCAFKRGYIGYNTWVGRANTDEVVTWGLYAKNRHADTVFENNIILIHPNATFNNYIKFEGEGALGVTWRNNLCNKAFPAGMGGTGSITTALNASTLVNAFPASITGTYDKKDTGLPSVVTSLNDGHFDLSATSVAIGAASNRSNPYSWTLPPVNIDRHEDGRTDANASQGRYYDMGSDEYGGSAPPPEDDTITANFNRTPSSGTAPLTVQYTDTSVVTGSASITGWLWQFGDGTTSTSQNPSKTYNTAGTYTTTLTITDSVNSLTSSFTGGSVTVTAVAGGTVEARYTRTPAAAEVGDTITFTDTSIATGDAVINSWNYDFRDETSSTSQNPTKVYATAGTRRTRLTVRDTVRGYSHTWTGPETVITDTPVADAIEASFTQSATAGQAPLSVTFTDTSQEIGTAVIDGWSWDFGDGHTSTDQNPTNIYAEAGTYTPVLTITDVSLGLVDVYVGQTITVTTEEPPPAGGDVVLRQVRTALNTSSGNQTFTQAGLGGLTPKRARFIVTAATADGTAADGELMCVGATAGGNQWAACIAAAHGSANTNAARMWTDAACMLLIDADGVEVMRATFVAWEADGVTVNLDWTGTPAAYLVTVEFGAGTEYAAWVGTAAMGTTGSTTTPSAGFAPDAVRAVATWGDRETAATDATLSLGMAHRLGGTYCLERYYADGLADAANRSRLNSGEIAHCRYNGGGRAGVGIGLWSADGFTLTVTDNNINSTVLLLAEKFGTVGSRVALVDSATSTGNTDYTLDWDPQYVEHLISPRQGEGSSNDNALSGTIGLHTVTDDGEFSNEVSGENGSATTNEQSLSDNQFIVVGHTGTTLAAGATTLGTTKYTINYTTAPATAQKYPSLAVEEGQASGGGGDYVTAEFTADVVSGQVPLRVQFFDLSSATNTITSWLWDFGDGRTSTAKNPAHVYREEGPFTVSLVVSDGTISDTEEKADYIATTVRTARRGIIGPYFLRVITSETTAATHSDPDDEENAGYMDGELGQNVIRINADPETPAAVAGDWVIYADAASGDLKIVFPDGTVGTVTVA